MRCLIHADTDEMIMVSVDGHLVDLAAAASEVLDDAVALARPRRAELVGFDLLISPSI
jgi:hypothetical protein